MDTMSEEIFANIQQMLIVNAEKINQKFPELGPKGESETDILSWELREVAVDFEQLLERLNKINGKANL